VAELTPDEKEILRTLRQKGTQTKSRLAFQMTVPPGLLDDTLAKLDEAGLIELTPLKSEKSTDAIKITSNGLKTLRGSV